MLLNRIWGGCKVLKLVSHRSGRSLRKAACYAAQAFTGQRPITARHSTSESQIVTSYVLFTFTLQSGKIRKGRQAMSILHGSLLYFS